MANLVITVIAIALVAISALMGIYYGGATYFNRQADAEASMLLNMGGQTGAAFQDYMVDHYNTAPASWAQMVNLGYLKQILVFPALNGNNSGMNSGISLDGSGTYWLWGDIGSQSGKTPDPNALVCQDVLKRALGSIPSTIPTGGVNHTMLTGNTAGNGIYGCEINSSALNDAGALNVMPDNPGIVPDNHYAFFYKLN